MIRYAAAAILLGLVVVGQPGRAQDTVNTSAIAGALGRTGTVMPGDVYRVSFPRSDLNVSVGNVALLPALALGSYAAFKMEPQGTLAVGDLVLTEGEIQPVLESLRASGIAVTALHNHLRNEHPHVMYMHFMGTGDAATIAAALHKALALTRTPLGPATAANTAAPWFMSAIEQSLGRSGKAANGVVSVGVPRPEEISMQSFAVPPAMGVATSLNFQSAGRGTIATTGDFVLVASEVTPVERALAAHAIDVTAIHSHMVGDSPALYFMHFWAVGSPDAIGAGLKDALSHVATKP